MNRSKAPPEGSFIIAWEFEVTGTNRQAFERAYGPTGDWVQLFRTGQGYIKTELHRDPEHTGRYITLDFWNSREEYEHFRQSAGSPYQELDAKCAALTQHERLLGQFSNEGSLRATLPRVTAGTRVDPTIRIRRARVEDIPAMLEIEQFTPYAAHWTESAYLAAFDAKAPARIALVAESSDEICGFVVARAAAEDCELESIAVAARQVRAGIGSSLLRELCSVARSQGMRRVFLEVRESNQAARRLYEKLRFLPEGSRDAYYKEPEEAAILYSLEL